MPAYVLNWSIDLTGNNAPQHQSMSHSQLAITHDSLKDHFMTLLSPYSNSENDSTNEYNLHHNITTHKNEFAQHRHSYIINCICTFICHSLEKRHKYIKDVRDRETKLNTLVVYFNTAEQQ